jgi:hypothetical protein
MAGILLGGENAGKKKGVGSCPDAEARRFF